MNYLVSFFGKNERIERHYTVSSCMRKPFYEALVASLKMSLEGGMPALNSDLLSTAPTSSIGLTIKNYSIDKGLSKKLHGFDNLKDTVQVKGPMGKGLGLTSDSEGTYVAFSAGTGILPFIDLVARIALGALNLIPES